MKEVEEAFAQLAEACKRTALAWVAKQTPVSRAEWKVIAGCKTACALVSVSESLLDEYEGDEEKGEELAQRMADDAHLRMLSLVRSRLKIGRYAVSD